MFISNLTSFDLVEADCNGFPNKVVLSESMVKFEDQLKSFIETRKKKGPSMDPCENPVLICKRFDLALLYLTYW